jgi:hypothetical protein
MGRFASSVPAKKDDTCGDDALIDPLPPQWTPVSLLICRAEAVENEGPMLDLVQTQFIPELGVFF